MAPIDSETFLAGVDACCYTNCLHFKVFMAY